MVFSDRTRCFLVRILTFCTAYLTLGTIYSINTFTLYQNAMKKQYNLTQFQGECNRDLGRFNIKMPSYQFRNYHYQYKTVWRQSCLYNGIPINGKTVLISKQGPVLTLVGCPRKWVWLHYKGMIVNDINWFAISTATVARQRERIYWPRHRALFQYQDRLSI